MPKHSSARAIAAMICARDDAGNYVHSKEQRGMMLFQSPPHLIKLARTHVTNNFERLAHERNNRK